MEKKVEVKTITLDAPILGENAVLAARNRQVFQNHGVYVLNLISSPGSGKTTLLVETLKALQGRLRCAVIEGDQQTDCDASRIAETGAPVVQLNTISSCHLDAGMVGRALESLPLDNVEVLFIENVGNLICPADYDLGEHDKVVLMSVTEGEEKPIKYPLIFHLAKVLLLTKVDLLPHLRFDVDACIRNAHRVNPELKLIRTSTYTRDGLDEWVNWILAQRRRV